jgi:hypothetical protein
MAESGLRLLTGHNRYAIVTISPTDEDLLLLGVRIDNMENSIIIPT